MPFKNSITARLLTILGGAGQKIVGFVDNNGFPRFDFYTGSEDEIQPGYILAQFENATEPANDTTYLELGAPLVDSEARIQLRSGGTELSRFVAFAEEIVLDTGNGNAITLYPLGNGIDINPDGATAATARIFKSVAGGFSEVDVKDAEVEIRCDGGFVNVHGRLDMLEDAGGLNGIKGLFGRRILNFDCGNGTDTTSGGNGTINIPHNFPNTDFKIVPCISGAGTARFLTRVLSGDTSSTFQCRVWNDAGGNPANGTSIDVEWVGMHHL